MLPTDEEPTYRRKQVRDSTLQDRLKCVKMNLSIALLMSCLLLVLDCDEIEREATNDKGRHGRGRNEDDDDEGG